MNNIEEILGQKKNEIKQIPVPDEMEVRLRSALEKRGTNPGIRQANWKVKVAVLCILALVIGWQADTLAYYGKKLLGYDSIMNGTLQELNESGKGQSINKTYTYKDGTILTLDGIMLDDNQLLAYYTIKNPHRKLDFDKISLAPAMKGIVKEYMMNSSQGIINEKETEVKYIASFDSPYFFEKHLQLVCSLGKNGAEETGSISFKLDRNQAMGHTLKQTLHKSAQIDETKIYFDTIMATPTTTIIKGTLQSPLELARDQILDKRFRPNELTVELIANGKKLDWQGAGLSTNVDGMTFEQRFDALPSDLNDLKLNLVSFSSDHDVHQVFPLAKGDMKQSNQIKGQQIDFQRLYTSEGNTYLTISSEESVILTKVYLIIDGEKVSLEETIQNEYDKQPDGAIIHTRTLRFTGTGQEYQLDIQRMSYSKTYNKIIDIPIK